MRKTQLLPFVKRKKTEADAQLSFLGKAWCVPTSHCTSMTTSLEKQVFPQGDELIKIKKKHTQQLYITSPKGI